MSEGDKFVEELRQRKDASLRDVKTKPGAALKNILIDLPVRDKNIGKKPEKKEGKKDSKKQQNQDDEQHKKEKKAFEDKAKEIRKFAADCVLSVLCSIETAKLSGAIKELTDEERDTLMKFVYRGFSERIEVDDKNGKKSKAAYDCNILLKTHEEIIKISGGNGPIIRTIHTRLEV